MRISITLQSLDLTWGGIGTYTEEIVKHLLQIDRDNEYILIYPGFGASRKQFGRYQRRFRNVIEVETDFSRFPSGWYWDQMIIPKVATQYGVDVLFNPFLSIPLLGRFKKVMIMHAVEYHTVPKVYNWQGYIKWFFLEKCLLPAADRVISVSNVMTQDICRVLKFPLGKLRTIYHGVSDKFRVIQDREKLQEVREEYQLPAEFILFVGHLYPQKNFATFVRAFHRIAKEIPHDLVIVGRPRWKYAEDLSLVDRLELRERMHFLYYVPHHDLPAIYNLARCFAFPSLYESFGLVQLEAMACGCPVVAARAGAIPEISGDAALLFDPHDSEEMAEALLKVIADHCVRQSLIAKGLEHVRKFTWDRCAAETLQIFRELAEK